MGFNLKGGNFKYRLEVITSQEIGKFLGKFASNVPKTNRPAIFLLFNCPRVLSFRSNKAIFFTEVIFQDEINNLQLSLLELL